MAGRCRHLLPRRGWGGQGRGLASSRLLSRRCEEDGRNLPFVLPCGESAYLYGRRALPYGIVTHFANRHRASASAEACGDNHGRDGKQHADVDAMCGGFEGEQEDLSRRTRNRHSVEDVAGSASHVWVGMHLAER